MLQVDFVVRGCVHFALITPLMCGQEDFVSIGPEGVRSQDIRSQGISSGI